MESGVMSIGDRRTGRPSLAVTWMNAMWTRAFFPKMPGWETSVTAPWAGVPCLKITDR
jgi:hypothetical protein